MTTDPAKRAWQSSVEVAGALPLDDVRKGADKFYRAIRRRNAIEYIAAAVVVVVFTAYVFTMSNMLQKVGSALIVLAALYAPWQLHRRGSAVPPERAGTMPLYAFLRGQLVRQRDALKGIFGWYILPFVPGLVLINLGNTQDPEFATQGAPPWVKWLVMAAMLAILAGIWWLNQLGARKLQRHIDEIDALTGESE